MTDDHRTGALESRVTKLEDWRIKMDEWRASQSIESAVASDRYKNIEKRLDSINGHITKLVWLLVTGLVVPVIAFVVNGGLFNG